ncbi:hypothetical protein [Streptomyces javensis]|uniref:Uncharacterized protein n=1 Tax=Streptomyces javensis TaxID=114698 RepID=A0ABS0RR07_9ACTN|nr:hypothetical protein [Streptomyces javensis]MBI0319908.1 hypothetical protein [Streptomyces javensis]
MNTRGHLRRAVELIEKHGLLTGDSDGFIGPNGELDVCLAIYQGATGVLPEVFRTDADAAIELIKASVWAMAAIRAVYDTLDSSMDADGPDEVIDRVSHWANTAPDRHSRPPTRTEVMGRLLRVAEDLDHKATALAA